VGVVVIDICLQQLICDDVVLICINLLTFIAVIYSYKTIFLFIFSAQICVLKHQNSLAPGEGTTLPPHPPPPRRLRRLDTRRLRSLEFLAPPLSKPWSRPSSPALIVNVTKIWKKSILLRQTKMLGIRHLCLSNLTTASLPLTPL